MKSIYILLTATGTLFARTIRGYTRKPYSHASISLDKNCEELYSFSRKYTNNPFIGCFLKENINKNVFGKYPNAPCELLEIEVTDEQFEKIKEIIESMKGKKYNVKGIFYRIIHKPYINKKHKFFCSEFVAYTLQTSNVCEFKKSFNLIDPTDFLDIPEANSIYKGALCTVI